MHVSNRLLASLRPAIGYQHVRPAGHGRTKSTGCLTEADLRSDRYYPQIPRKSQKLHIKWLQNLIPELGSKQYHGFVIQVTPTQTIQMILTGVLQMRNTLESIKKFLQEEEGLSAVEYAIAGALVVGTLVASFTALGEAVSLRIQALTTAVGG